jgi:predicted NBD/HSP70 family sugar kinase
MSTLGIDIGGTAVKAAVLHTDGSSQTALSAAYARPDRSSLRSAVAMAVGGLDVSGVSAVGLCVPGRRGASGDRIDLAVNVPGLQHYPFRSLVSDALGRDVPVRICSDAEAATLDAARDFPGARRVLGIAIGTGVGASLIETGRPIRIGSGTIGHLGQVDIGLMPGVPAPGPIGPDGGRNSLEAYLGAPALRERLGSEPGDVMRTLTPDDPAVLALVRAVRIGLAIYTPDLVVLLGGIGLSLEPLGSVIEAVVRTDLTSIAPSGWRLAFGRSRFHAALGAARWAADDTGIG